MCSSRCVHRLLAARSGASVGIGPVEIQIVLHPLDSNNARHRIAGTYATSALRTRSSGPAGQPHQRMCFKSRPARDIIPAGCRRLLPYRHLTNRRNVWVFRTFVVACAADVTC